MKAKAKVIIICYGHLLLLKPLGKKKLTMIGGSIDKNEKPAQALIREAKEEANVVLEMKYLNFFYSREVIINEKPCMFHCFVMEGKDVPFELREKHKFKYVDWIPLKESLSRLKGVELSMVLRYLNSLSMNYSC